jgi:hypothetical protein
LRGPSLGWLPPGRGDDDVWSGGLCGGGTLSSLAGDGVSGRKLITGGELWLRCQRVVQGTRAVLAFAEADAHLLKMRGGSADVVYCSFFVIISDIIDQR